ncbi:C4-type zinc ribbon domain-containing protein [Chloroflexota bacterium]
MEAEWKNQQQQLAVEIEKLQDLLIGLEQQKTQAAAAIGAETMECYKRLRRQKGLAVARVEQGTCRGCRISLSTAELQRAKGSRLVMCSNCGRILFID